MTLSDVSDIIRRFGPIALIGFVLLLIFFAIINLTLTAITNRPQVTEFVPAYGNVPKTTFSNTFDYPPNATFRIDNIEGRPLTATSSARIFFIPEPKTGLGYNRDVIFMGRAAGFNIETEEYELNDITATYENADQRLDIDIRNGNFVFETEFRSKAPLFENATIPDENVILQTAQAFLKQMNRFPNAFNEGTYNIIYQNYNPATDTFSKVNTIQEANVVEVDFFPPDIDGFPIVVPKYYNSQNFVVIAFEGTPGRTQPTILKAQVQHYERDVTGGAEYPVKTGDEAWEEFINGEGAIVSAAPNSGTNIVIKEMFLGYYDPQEYQEYLQPVYVFLGDNDFAAYVPAIVNDYVEGGESETEEN